jgi:hypothetical protein
MPSHFSSVTASAAVIFPLSADLRPYACCNHGYSMAFPHKSFVQPAGSYDYKWYICSLKHRLETFIGVSSV